jgi:hypothetical protein
MTTFEQRQILLALISEARKDGARQHQACELIGLDARTIQRWRHPQGQLGDLRIVDKRRITVPANKLSNEERMVALEILNNDQFKDLPPSHAVFPCTLRASKRFVFGRLRGHRDYQPLRAPGLLSECQGLWLHRLELN